MFAALWLKEWRLLRRSLAYALALSYLVLAWLIAASISEYQALAPQLAQLDNQKGATEMLLGTMNDALKWLWLLWSVFFAARLLAQERQWRTDVLYHALPIKRLLAAKALFLLPLFILLSLPFWLTVYVLGRATAWDQALLLAQALAQLFWMLYAIALGLCCSSMNRQSLSACLSCALAWLLLWLLPSLSSQPPSLVAWLQYLSPFEHFALLQRGILSVQTVFYFGSSIALLLALVFYFWRDAS